MAEPQEVPVPSPAKSALAGPKVLLIGPTGTGKTHCLGTLVDAGVEVFYQAYEQGTESLYGYWTDRNLPIPKNLHISTVSPAQASFEELAYNANLVNSLSLSALKKATDPNRSKYNQFEQFLRSFNQVTEDGTGLKFGAADKWGTGRCLVIDGMTGLGDSAMKAVIGGKADRDQSDWGLAQNMLENFLRTVTTACRCWVVLIAHVERETDQVLGGSKLTISTLGRALAPKIPPMFSDVILTTRNGKEWWWDTENPQADLKTRNLPISSKVKPDFGQIVAKWKSRGGVLEAQK